MDKILVMDDDLDILMIMQTLLTMYGYAVESTSHCEQAIDKTIHLQPDIVLMDVYCGRQDGRTMCKELKSLENTKHIPVILMSSKLDVVKNLKDCLADDFIAKPFKVEELLAKLRQLKPGGSGSDLKYSKLLISVD